MSADGTEQPPLVGDAILQSRRKLVYLCGKWAALVRGIVGPISCIDHGAGSMEWLAVVYVLVVGSTPQVSSSDRRSAGYVTFLLECKTVSNY